LNKIKQSKALPEGEGDAIMQLYDLSMQADQALEDEATRRKAEIGE